MTTFGERLNAAAAAAGIDVAERAVRLAQIGGISARTAERYLTLERADLNADTAYSLARGLHVRVGWLLKGEAPMAYRPEAFEAVRIVERLSRVKLRRWLSAGRRMAETE